MAKLNIAYTKTAKKMDVKRLKACMWGLLMKGELKKLEKEVEYGRNATYPIQ